MPMPGAGWAGGAGPRVEGLALRGEVSGGCSGLGGRPGLGSALALLVLGVGADHHDPAVAADHPALVAHLLD
ncbi:protein of unknown function [Cyanobium sp. NIES-981]|nr:protein of unknown function [Cyanobium sp. NIES-981]